MCVFLGSQKFTFSVTIHYFEPKAGVFHSQFGEKLHPFSLIHRMVALPNHFDHLDVDGNEAETLKKYILSCAQCFSRRQWCLSDYFIRIFHEVLLLRNQRPAEASLCFVNKHVMK